MGNKNNRVKKLPKFTSPPTLDELPVEIIYKILDELDLHTIFTSFHHVCKHFDEILSTYSEYNFNLKNLSLKNLKLISSHIRPDQVTELTLSDAEYNSGLIEFFLSKYSIHEFSRLRSLTLIQINNEEYMNQILISIPECSVLLNLSSIKIIHPDENYGDIFIELIMPVLTKTSLRKVYFHLSYNRTTSNPLPWLELCSIRHLTFNSTCTVNFVRNTLIYMPDLETFITDDFDFNEEIDWNHVPNNQDDDIIEEEIPENPNRLPKKEEFASFQTPNCLNSLILNASTISMSKLEWVLPQMPTLKHLRLITATTYDESILDGQRWEKLLSNMDKFEFVFSVNLILYSTYNADTCITKFQSSFWTEEKQWFVSLEKYDDEIILYTLPYRSTVFVVKNESISFEYYSTADENSILRTQPMNNVRELYIDPSNMKKSQLVNSISPRFPHVKNLYLYGKWPKSNSFFSDIQTIVDLNHVEEFMRDERVPTKDFITLINLMPNLQSIKTTTDFLDALSAATFCYKKCLRSFTIDSNIYGDQRSVNIEPFCAMFPRIQNLIIPVDGFESCRYALDQLNQDLITVIFRVPDGNDSITTDSENDEEEENFTNDAFLEWKKELPKEYYCDKNQQEIYIRLK